MDKQEGLLAKASHEGIASVRHICGRSGCVGREEVVCCEHDYQIGGVLSEECGLSGWYVVAGDRIELMVCCSTSAGRVDGMLLYECRSSRWCVVAEARNK